MNKSKNPKSLFHLYTLSKDDSEDNKKLIQIHYNVYIIQIQYKIQHAIQIYYTNILYIMYNETLIYKKQDKLNIIK